MKDIFTVSEFKGIIFFFSTLKILLHCLLVSIITNEVSATFFVFVPLYVMCFFLLWGRKKIVSVSLVLNTFNIMFLGVVFFMFPVFGVC